MSDALERAKKKILENAQREIDELERLSAAASKYGMELIPKDDMSFEPPITHPETGKIIRHEKSWRKTILSELGAFPKGATSADLRGALMDTHLGERLSETDSGFYNTISKMIRSGEVEKYRGSYFLPFMLRRFQADVEAGLQPDIPTHNADQGANRSLILALASEVGDFTATEAFHHLGSKNPGGMKSQNSIYNLLSRMVASKEIAKEGTKYSLCKENGEPIGSPETENEEATNLFSSQNPKLDHGGQ